MTHRVWVGWGEAHMIWAWCGRGRGGGRGPGRVCWRPGPALLVVGRAGQRSQWAPWLDRPFWRGSISAVLCSLPEEVGGAQVVGREVWVWGRLG